MNKNLIAAFAAPAIAAVSIAVSASLASGAGLTQRAAYGADANILSAADAGAYAASVFSRADLDKSGALDVDEYASLALVTAELARLNGFVPIETGAEARIVQLPLKAPEAMPRMERARVDAVSRRNFYLAAGEDNLLSLGEFESEKTARFEQADRNRNGALTETELVSFAAKEAELVQSDV